MEFYLSFFLAVYTFYCRKKNAVMGKGVVVVVVLGAGNGACREQIQNFPREEAVQSALPVPLPYCLLKITNY